jgi:hypothetical protein
MEVSGKERERELSRGVLVGFWTEKGSEAVKKQRRRRRIELQRAAMR